MRILISGATGLIGTALTARLTADGHHPIRLVRASPAGFAAGASWGVT